MYPDDSIQYLTDSWWQIDDGKEIKRGRLLKAFVPHSDQIPMVLIPEGRKDPTSHSKINYRTEPLRIGKAYPPPTLPVAALPVYSGELRLAYRAKKRPVLVISCGGPDIPPSLRTGAARWQTSPTILVAPYYGVEQSGSRGGWREEFVARIRRCEYSKYIWDKLPINSRTEESILRLDHIQPIGRHYDAFELTPHILSKEALAILDEWIYWLIRNKFPEKSILFEVREDFMKI